MTPEQQERDEQAVRQGEPMAPEVDLTQDPAATVAAAAGQAPDADLATRTGATVTGKDEEEE